MNFADCIHQRIEQTGSRICAGFDPRPDTIPMEFHDQADKNSSSNEEFIFNLLSDFYCFALESLANDIACIKPNAAFFEQFGPGGVRALVHINQHARERSIPVIFDAKRGDIGSTAEAYSRACLGTTTIGGRSYHSYLADAVTVNPFLGFDTLEPFLKDCAEYGKGMFVLVKTSNEGSASVQSLKNEAGTCASDLIADWIHQHTGALKGTCGFSSLGAVLGATYPEEARSLRMRMPDALCLIPGLGAQGGTAKDAVASLNESGHGGVINISRGLLSSFSNKDISRELAGDELAALAARFNQEISAALGRA